MKRHGLKRLHGRIVIHYAVTHVRTEIVHMHINHIMWK